MTGKQAYRRFLQSDFWKGLSAKHKATSKGCERCGSRDRLQSHHKFYREDWYQTEIGDLEVLCRKCHRKAHGIVPHPWAKYPFMVYRDDPEFSATIYRVDCLTHRVITGRGLRLRDERFLKRAIRLYQPTKKDRCMYFHIEQAWIAQERFLTGAYSA